MDRMNHKTVIATNDELADREQFEAWWYQLNQRERSMFTVVKGVTEYGFTIILAPDCAPEDSADSEWGDTLREKFRNFLKSRMLSDGSNCWSWVEVVVGEDDHAQVIASSEHDYDEFQGKLEQYSSEIEPLERIRNKLIRMGSHNEAEIVQEEILRFINSKE